MTFGKQAKYGLRGMNVIDRDNHMPLYIQLRDDMKRRMNDGQWEVGERIPTERELMESYEVGRATVREAVNLLVSEGCLLKKQGIGTFVARKHTPLGFEPLISLSHTLKIRGIKEENQVILKETKKGESGDELHVKRVRNVDKLPVAIENYYFNGKIAPVFMEFDFKTSVARFMMRRLGVAIRKLVQEILIREATREEQELLKMEHGEKVVAMKRWLYAEASEDALQYMEFVTPEKMLEYSLENI